MSPTRRQLQDFYHELRSEYDAFRELHQLDRLRRKELGDRYEEEWF